MVTVAVLAALAFAQSTPAAAGEEPPAPRPPPFTVFIRTDRAPTAAEDAVLRAAGVDGFVVKASASSADLAALLDALPGRPVIVEDVVDRGELTLPERVFDHLL